MHKTLYSTTLAMLVIIAPLNLHAQQTASEFFEILSMRYKSIQDYSADVVITRGGTVQRAKVQYKSPNLFRMDYAEPAGMIIVANEETLQVWVPEYSAAFKQTLRRFESTGSPNIATAQGLELLSKYYTIAYAESLDPVQLDANNPETVVKLRLNWKTNKEGFRNIVLSINTRINMIRRVVGLTTTGDTITFDFTNIVIDEGIPGTRFNYEAPPTGNTIENFLFTVEEE